MKTYIYFCASVYQFYVRKKDSAPDAITFWLTTTVLTLNFFTIYDLFRYYVYKELVFNKVFYFIVFGAIAVINFFLFFYKGSYKKEFPSRKFGNRVVIYLIVSLAAVIFTSTLHRERNLQKKHQIEIMH